MKIALLFIKISSHYKFIFPRIQVLPLDPWYYWRNHITVTQVYNSCKKKIIILKCFRRTFRQAKR